MELRLDSVLIGRVLAGVVVFLAVVSAIVGAASAQSGGFETFLARLAVPLGVGILILAATGVLKAVQDRQGAAQRAAAPRSAGTSERTRTRRAAPGRSGGAPGSVALPGPEKFNVNLRLSVGGIGASILSVFAFIGVFVPWIAVVVSYGGESESLRFTMWEASGEMEDSLFRLFFFVLLALGIVGAASVVLPRWASLIVAVAGTAVAVFAFVYIFASVEEDTGGDLGLRGLDFFTIPHIGFALTAGGFLLATTLLAIPGLNRAKSQGRAASEL
ncbi:MAG: hypothetical protein OXI91_13555 [Chloroflexota bacterium]|nr:hypothetical protein [Chloroflexota bacterium]